MPAPLAKGLIIAASALLAVGVALYESPAFRQWVDESRRKIAVALYSLGDEVNPGSGRSNGEQESEEARQERREEIVRRNRAELIRRAREEGIAVDLDELAAIGTEKIREHIKDLDEKMASLKEMGFTDEERNSTLLAAYDGNLEQAVEQLVYLTQTEGNRVRASRAESFKSFDSIVGDDGTLLSTAKGPEMSELGHSTALSSSNTLRHRGQGNSAYTQGSTWSNPFGDEHALMYDAEEMANPAPTPAETDVPNSRETTATLAEQPTEQLVDLTEPDTKAETESIDGAATESTLSFDSLYDDPDIPRPSRRSTLAPINVAVEPASSPIDTPTGLGALTPTTDGFDTAMSFVASDADDVGVLSSVPASDTEEGSEYGGQLSDMGNLSVVGEDAPSEMSYSDVGASTPGSWTDVESDGWSEAGNGEPREVTVVPAP